MLIYTKIAELQAFLEGKKKEGKTIGFVPTMGALHTGHISLVKAAAAQCGIVVCSIFVNPTQFNDKHDLERYPRTPEKDAALLSSAGCDVLLMPAVSEIYPPNYIAPNFNFGYLGSVLEGSLRPGHFNGVAQVVKRLFDITAPHKAFFGSKDYQQVLIVQALLKLTGLPVEIVACPILREPDGLAMSSRNQLLSPEERQTAGHISRIMVAAKSILHSKGIKAAKNFVQNETSSFQFMRLEYYEVCHAQSLKVLEDTENPAGAIALIALYVGKIRLIDNLI